VIDAVVPGADRKGATAFVIARDRPFTQAVGPARNIGVRILDIDRGYIRAGPVQDSVGARHGIRNRHDRVEVASRFAGVMGATIPAATGPGKHNHGRRKEHYNQTG